ncbi:hypothetical protein NF212_15900 [Parasalinivibrio latis]|uniref:hypothetical protein n=1 Tax=Parasalinivibrio latis TaxID=2952610 RepID=UPI0030DED05C
MKLTRRTWNNILIIGITVFCMLILLPDLIKSRMAESEPVAQQSELLRLFPLDSDIHQLNFPSFSLNNDAGWKADKPLLTSGDELASRWLNLEGTEISGNNLSKLKPALRSPRSLEAWDRTREEPFRITYYQLPQFWVLQNGNSQWLAVSVDEGYLFPLAK